MIIFFVVTVVFLAFIYYKGNHRKLDNNITIDYNSYWMKND